MCVVHCKKAKHDVYIGRPSRWGNPFSIGKHGSRAEVIALYRHRLHACYTHPLTRVSTEIVL